MSETFLFRIFAFQYHTKAITMKTNGITVDELIKQLPDELLDKLSEKYEVNYQVKKLTGILMFKLLLYMIVCTQRGSLNTIMALFEDMRFRLFTGITSSFTTQRNSLSDRLKRCLDSSR